MKSTLPNGQLPVLEIEHDGIKEVIGQSDAILRYVGKIGGLYSSDPIVALKIDSVVDLIDDFTHPLSMSLSFSKTLISEKDLTDEEKHAFRMRFTEKAIPKYFSKFVEILISNGTGWLVGDSMTIADTKLYQAMYWLTTGVLDGIPKNCADSYPHLLAHYKKILSEKSIADWYKKKGESHYNTSEFSP